MRKAVSPTAAVPEIPDKLYFRIGEVARLAGVKQYVLRYWETEFPILSPQKSGSQQRMYARKDVENCLLIKHLLYDKKFSIEGARRRISELRRSGELAEARKPKFVMESEQFTAIEDARQELKALLDLVRLEQ